MPKHSHRVRRYPARVRAKGARAPFSAISVDGPCDGYPFRFFVAAGGLMSYGTDFVDKSRQAASYVDRILRGANAADLPVQAPTKYETVLNLKAAKALGLDGPPSLLVRADEVIE
jgi:hypothetical protein